MKVHKYIPIDCNFYDRLEAWSTQKARVEVVSHDGQMLQGQIVDLYTKDHEEYLIMDNGFKLRLDKILTVNGIKPENNCTIVP